MLRTSQDRTRVGTEARDKAWGLPSGHSQDRTRVRAEARDKDWEFPS